MSKTTTKAQMKTAINKVKTLIAQVAAAEARDIAALDGSKQDKITGAAGQVVGFGADGMPVAQSTASLVGPPGPPGPMGTTGITTTSVTIPTSGWGSDSTAVWPKYFDIAASGVTENDYARVDLPPASLPTAAACGLCPSCETLTGKIRIRAEKVPTATMTAQCRIEKG